MEYVEKLLNYPNTIFTLGIIVQFLIFLYIAKQFHHQKKEARLARTLHYLNIFKSDEFNKKRDALQIKILKDNSYSGISQNIKNRTGYENALFYIVNFCEELSSLYNNNLIEKKFITDSLKFFLEDYFDHYNVDFIPYIRRLNKGYCIEWEKMVDKLNTKSLWEKNMKIPHIKKYL